MIFYFIMFLGVRVYSQLLLSFYRGVGGMSMPVCGDFRVATQPCGVPVSSEKVLSLVRSCHGFWAVMHIGSSHLAPSTTLKFDQSFLPPS
jgi:hypothetical protein